ncbi:hypothetical protein ACFE04_008259 [Oxalis oulophora]
MIYETPPTGGVFPGFSDRCSRPRRGLSLTPSFAPSLMIQESYTRNHRSVSRGPVSCDPVSSRPPWPLCHSRPWLRRMQPPVVAAPSLASNGVVWVCGWAGGQGKGAVGGFVGGRVGFVMREKRIEGGWDLW